MSVKLMKGDCLELMQDIEASSIDMVLCDLPYGTTACDWDSTVSLKPLWAQYSRVVKSNGVIALFASEPFATHLRVSAIDIYKYDWIWVKTTSAGFVHAKNRPLKSHEVVCIFSKGSMGHASLLGDKRMRYNPQGLTKSVTVHKNALKKFGGTIGARPSHKNEFTSEYTNYPKDILFYESETGLHPTQKPVKLLEYLIRTYTNEGETVLDNTMGSGSTGVACVNTNRNFIGIELDEAYYETACKRIKDAQAQPRLFEVG